MRLSFLCLLYFLLAGKAKGQEPHKIWILTVGISDYQYLNDLNFADDDAKAFLAYAKESLGERFVHDQVRILLNDEATASSIRVGLEWILRNSKARDRVYFYFSGHGGYEDLTNSKLGYLHAHDSFDATYANGGNIQLILLEGILNTLSERDIETFMILDACHAGKVVNNDYLFLNNSLSSMIPNVNKILSAQGMEKSLEGSQWGGGHGVFTYYLLNGILGRADDEPLDNSVSLFELEKYLINNVPHETNQSQIPIVIAADKRKRMFPVIKTDLAKPNEQTFQQPLKKAENTRSIVDLNLSEEDQALIKLKHYLDENDLIVKGHQPIFAEFDRAAKLLHTSEKKLQLSDILITYLLDNTQYFINVFMGVNEGSPNELKTKKAEYTLFEATTKMLSIIDNNHPSYPIIESRRIFFESEIFHNEFDAGKKVVMNDIIPKLDYGISLEPTSSYLKYQAGVLKYHAADYASARKYLKEARKYSPQWSFPDIVIGLTFLDTNLDSAMHYYRSSLSKFPKTPALYYNMADYFRRTAEHETDKVKGRIKMDSVIYYLNATADASEKGFKADEYADIGDAYEILFKDWNDNLYRQKAINYYKKAVVEGTDSKADLCSVISSLALDLNNQSAEGYFFWAATEVLFKTGNGLEKFETAFSLGFSDWDMLQILPEATITDKTFKELVDQYRKK